MRITDYIRDDLEAQAGPRCPCGERSRGYLCYDTEDDQYHHHLYFCSHKCADERKEMELLRSLVDDSSRAVNT